MEAVLTLIEQIIAEHHTILQRLEDLEEVANDAEALRGFEQAQESFVPGRLNERQGLERLEKLVSLVDQGLRAHFDREETALLAAFEGQGSRELASAFHSLLLEHADLKNRIARTREQVAQLTGGQLSRHSWEATANDLRAHVSHTHRLLQAHAEAEQELLISLLADC